MVDLLWHLLLPLQQIYNGTATMTGRTAAIAPAAKGQMYLQRCFFGLQRRFWPATIVLFLVVFRVSHLVVKPILGKILECPETNYEFPNLQILDLSYNIFTGNLPFNRFRIWNASKLDNHCHLTYIQEKEYFNVGTHHLHYYYDYSMKITNKGLKPSICQAIDLLERFQNLQEI